MRILKRKNLKRSWRYKKRGQLREQSPGNRRRAADENGLQSVDK